MNRHILLSCALFASAFLGAAPTAATSQYVEMGGGEDVKLFLDPYLSRELKEVSGAALLDAGCGVGDWSIVAAQNGATVWGIAQEEKVLENAQAASINAGVNNQIVLTKGEVDKLPFDAATFDRAFSVNIGCQLPMTYQLASEDNVKVIGLEAHFREMARVLKENGRLLVVAPVSLGVQFTDGSCTQQQVLGRIQEVLESIGSHDNEYLITCSLGELTQVMRAAFVHREDRLVLVTDEQQLIEGELIWYKTPTGVMNSYYHSEQSYLVAIKNAGLTCEEIKRPCFFGKVKYDQYRASLKEDEKGLGEAYVEHNPFTLFYVVKRA